MSAFHTNSSAWNISSSPARAAVALLICLWITLGCRRTVTEFDATEPARSTTASAAGNLSWSEQIEAVDQGRSSRIKVTEKLVTDSDLEMLSESTNLEELIVSNSEISNKGIAALASLTKLRTLNLGTTRLSDDGLRHLSALSQLELLRFGSSEIEGPGFVHFTSLPRLRFLIVNNAPIDDDALRHLEQMTQLESLYLERTAVTDAGIARLREALPGLHVHW